MKTFKYFTIAIMAICLVSCGNKNNSSVTISEISWCYDDMTDFLREVIDIESDECVIEKSSFGQTTKLVLESRSNDDNKEKTSKISKIENGTIVLALLDDDGVEIGEMELENSKEVFNWLKTADFLAKKTFSFKGNLSFDVLSKAKEIKYRYKGKGTIDLESDEALYSDDDDNIGMEEEDDDDDDSYSSSSSSGSQDWDALLDSYEQYVDKYISLMKKASQGDMNALAEYPALMEKAQEVSERMEDAKDEMSSSQMARYLKITNKMATAASKMQ